MASSKEYLNYILEQLTGLDEISYRYMMGEYVLYYRGKIFGGICDDQLLVKPVQAARRFLPHGPKVLPYPGGKAMLLVEQVDDRPFLCDLIAAMYEDLPARKPRKKKG